MINKVGPEIVWHQREREKSKHQGFVMLKKGKIWSKKKRIYNIKPTKIK